MRHFDEPAIKIKIWFKKKGFQNDRALYEIKHSNTTELEGKADDKFFRLSQLGDTDGMNNLI